MSKKEIITDFITWAELNRDFNNPWFEDQCLHLLDEYLEHLKKEEIR